MNTQAYSSILFYFLLLSCLTSVEPSYFSLRSSSMERDNDVADADEDADEHAAEQATERRQLVGSNCILIERGTVPPYYDCVGCVIEEAQGCLDDMRYNLSGNVDKDCQLNSAMEFYDSDNCCPNIKKDLAYQVIEPMNAPVLYENIGRVVLTVLVLALVTRRDRTIRKRFGVSRKWAARIR